MRALLVLVLLFALRPAGAAPSLRIAFIDPLSGPFALTGEIALKRFRQEAARAKRDQGIAFEIVPFDNKASAQESLTVLQQAIDGGLRFVAQGQGSGAALAILEAVNRHNERNPGKEILYLNYAAIDPLLTNERCSFWHFRFDSHVGMRMQALAAHLASRPAIRKAYLVVQDYSFGHQFARAARERVAARRPDLAFVGEDRHPIGQVRDFAPYIAKIRASGADAVLTGNWGNDINLLVKAAREGALEAEFYTFYSGSPGALSAMGEAGVGRVHDVTDWHPNESGAATRRLVEEFRSDYGAEFHFFRVNTMFRLLTQALARARSADPAALARALEGMTLATDLGEVRMRAGDHQLLAPLVVASLHKDAANGGPREVRLDSEGTGMGWKTEARYPAADVAMPSTCRMRRP
jgi:branched-chain amino acid transport system substrate-binding protein